MPTETVTVEIRPAEGGQDAMLLAQDMATIYVSACKVEGYSTSGYA